MLELKNKKETENQRGFINVTYKDKYLGYIIKEPKEWVFVNESNNDKLTDKSKGYNSSLKASTKKLLIDIIKLNLN